MGVNEIYEFKIWKYIFLLNWSLEKNEAWSVFSGLLVWIKEERRQLILSVQKIERRPTNADENIWWNDEDYVLADKH